MPVPLFALMTMTAFMDYTEVLISAHSLEIYGSDQFTCRREYFCTTWIKGAQLSELVPGLFANGHEPLAEIHAYYDSEFELLSELSTLTPTYICMRTTTLSAYSID